MTKPVCYIGREDVYRNCGSEPSNYQPALDYLTQHVLQIAQRGYCNFMASTQPGVGQLACLAILKAREQNPDIKLIAWVPFPWQGNILKKSGMFNKTMHQEIIRQADEIRELDNPSMYAVVNNYAKCNRRMHDASDLTIGVTASGRNVLDTVEDIIRFGRNTERLEYSTPNDVMTISKT